MLFAHIGIVTRDFQQASITTFIGWHRIWQLQKLLHHSNGSFLNGLPIIS